MHYYNAHRTQPQPQWPNHPQHPQQRRQNSIFHVSNPSASDDHDQDPQPEFDLEYISPPSSQCHCYDTPPPATAEAAGATQVPPLVVDEKRWRQQFFRSGGTLRDTRKGRSVSPPRYTADEFEYPAGGKEEAYAYSYSYSYSHSHEDDGEQMYVPGYSPTAYDMATIPDRALHDPFPYSYTSDTKPKYAPPQPQPQTRIYAPPAEHYAYAYAPRDVPPTARRPSVSFAVVRPLTITRRRFSRQTRGVQLTDHHPSQAEAQAQARSHLPNTTTTPQRRRHSEGQAFYPDLIPDPYPYPYHTTHDNSFAQHQPRTQPSLTSELEFMGTSSSHDHDRKRTRTDGRSYPSSSSTLNNRRMSTAAARRETHPRPFSGLQAPRYHPIRLSYVDEDPEFRMHHTASSVSRSNEGEGDWDGDGDGGGTPARPQPPHLRPRPKQIQIQSQSRAPESQSRPHASDGKGKKNRTGLRAVSSQPQPHPGMQAKAGGGGGGNRNFKRMPYAENGERDWSTDICLFCDHNLGTCCKALWCPCVVYGRNKARIEHLHAEDKVHPARGGTFSNDCFKHACLTTFCLFGWAIQVPNRASIRRRYGIEGDWLGDCAAALFCSPCELAQESREIDLEERSMTRRSNHKEARDVA